MKKIHSYYTNIANKRTYSMCNACFDKFKSGELVESCVECAEVSLRKEIKNANSNR